jgi:TolB protein
LLLVSMTGVVQAQLVVEITEGIKRRPIAIVPFGWEGNADAMPTDVSQIISDDLTRSGRFAPIPEDDMLQKPTDGVNVDFDDWAILGVEAVVVGRVTQTGDNAYTCSFNCLMYSGAISSWVIACRQAAAPCGAWRIEPLT